jgi:hypothetical protein
MWILTKPASTFPEIPIPSRLCLFPVTRGSSSAIHPLLRLHEQKRPPFLIYKKPYYMVRKKTSCLPSTSKGPIGRPNCQLPIQPPVSQSPRPAPSLLPCRELHNAQCVTASYTDCINHPSPQSPPPQSSLSNNGQPGTTGAHRFSAHADEIWKALRCDTHCTRAVAATHTAPTPPFLFHAIVTRHTHLYSDGNKACNLFVHGLRRERQDCTTASSLAGRLTTRPSLGAGRQGGRWEPTHPPHLLSHLAGTF